MRIHFRTLKICSSEILNNNVKQFWSKIANFEHLRCTLCIEVLGGEKGQIVRKSDAKNMHGYMNYFPIPSP